jgi:hypothetical protein
MKNFKKYLFEPVNEDLTPIPQHKLKTKKWSELHQRRHERIISLIDKWNKLKPTERKQVFKSHRPKLKLMSLAATVGIDVASDPNDKWAHIRHIKHTGETAFKFPSSDVLTNKTEIESVPNPHHLAKHSSEQSEKLRKEGIKKRRGSVK